MELTLDIIKDVLINIRTLGEVENNINGDGDERIVVLKTDYEGIYLKLTYYVSSYRDDILDKIEFVKPKQVTVSNFESI